MVTFIIGVCLYLVIMAFVGYFASRRVNTMEDYVVAGRNLPLYLAVPTLVATWFGAGSSMGVSGTVYSQGFFGVIADPFGCSLALLIAGLFYAAPFRRLGVLTVSDLMYNAYGSTFEKVSTLLVIPSYVGILASQMLAMGYVFEVVSGMPVEIGIIIGSFIVIVYTVTGGMWAVTLTDCIQLVLIILGLVLIAPIAYNQVSDQEIVVQSFFHEFSTLIPKDSSQVNWLSYSGRILLTALGAIMSQSLIQRFLACKTERTARYSGLISAAIYFSLGLIPLFIGIAGRDIFPNLAKPEQLIPLLAKEFLSPFTFTLFACGLFSAIMSTADSYLLAGTSLLTNNILLKIWPVKEESSKIRLLRFVNLLISAMALGLAFSGQSIFDMIVHSSALLLVAIFIPASAALFWRGANRSSAWVSVIGGIVAWLGFILYYFDNLYINYDDVLFSAAVIGCIASLVCYVGTSIFVIKNGCCEKIKS